MKNSSLFILLTYMLFFVFLSSALRSENIKYEQDPKYYEDDLELTDGATEQAQSKFSDFFKGLGNKLSVWFSKSEPSCTDLKGILAKERIDPNNNEEIAAFKKLLLEAESLKNEQKKCDEKFFFKKSCLDKVAKLIEKLTSCAYSGPKSPAIRPPSTDYKNIINKLIAKAQNIIQVQASITVPRSLLVFLDEGEILGGSQAFTMKAVAALNLNAGPILLTGSLLSHIFNIDGKHDQDDKKILNIFYQQFDARKWTIMDIGENHSFFLLIPELNLNSKTLGIKLETEKNKVNPLKITPVNNKSKDSLMTYVKDFYEKFNAPRQAWLPTLQAEFLQVFKELFIAKSASEKDIAQVSNWVIYLGAHGGFNYSIAGLSIKGNPSEFQMFLDILDKTINTKLFVYDSCYASAFNAKEIYGELTSKSGARTYAFPIVTGATTDAVTYSGRIEAKGNAIVSIIKSEIKYDEFVNEAKKELINFKLAAGHIFPLVKRQNSFKDEIAGIPQLRPANSPGWFPVNDDDKAVIRIGSVMARTRTKPLLIKKYQDINGYMQDPKAILLATQSVPFPIIMDAELKGMVPLISISPGLAFHQLAYVEIRKGYFPALGPKTLTAFIEYGATKLFWIKELFIKEENVRYKNVVIETEDGNVKAYGTNKSTGKAMSLTSDQTPPKDYQKHYEELATKMGANAELGLTFVDVDKRDKFSQTPLMKAAYYNDVKSVKALLEAGADVYAKDDSGDTALDYAKFVRSNSEAEKLILQAMEKANPK